MKIAQNVFILWHLENILLCWRISYEVQNLLVGYILLIVNFFCNYVERYFA